MVAIIAAASPRVDKSFVMALQVARFLTILAIGPRLAQLVARRAAFPPGRKATKP